MYEITFSKVFSFVRLITCIILAAVIILRFFTSVYVRDSTFWLLVFVSMPNILSFFWNADANKETKKKDATTSQK